MKSDMKWISWIWGFTVGVIRLWWQKDYPSHTGKKWCYCMMAYPHTNMNRDISIVLGTICQCFNTALSLQSFLTNQPSLYYPEAAPEIKSFQTELREWKRHTLLSKKTELACSVITKQTYVRIQETAASSFKKGHLF